MSGKQTYDLMTGLAAALQRPFSCPAPLNGKSAVYTGLAGHLELDLFLLTRVKMEQTRTVQRKRLWGALQTSAEWAVPAGKANSFFL